MKKISHYLITLALNFTIAFFGIIIGAFVYHSNEAITNFEAVIIAFSVFFAIKGIIAFVREIWVDCIE